MEQHGYVAFSGGMVTFSFGDDPTLRKNREHKGKSIVSLPNDYIVIDTETTGLDYDLCHLIEVSAIHYVDGKKVDSYSSLIKPPLESIYDGDTGEMVEEYVDSYITELTGITNDMLAQAPDPEQVIPGFMRFIGNAVLIGHNVNFDVNFLYDAAEQCGLTLTNNFIDTLRISKKILPDLKRHRLKDVAEELGISHNGAHRAEADCEITAQCYEAMRARILTDSSEEEFEKLFKRDCKKRAELLASITANVDEIDETNPVFGKVVVFTGALSTMERKDAFQIVANLGGIPKDSVTKKTNYLVIGNSDFVQSVKNGKTTKMRQAEEYRQKGCDIVTLSENTFFDLISDYL